MRARFSLSNSFLREHRLGYSAFAALLVFAGVLSAAELVLFLALGSGKGISWGDYSAVEQVVMRNSLAGSAGLFRFMGGITIVISLILVFFAFRNMMAGRQRELGQMRLLGASPRQVRIMVAAEAGTFAAVTLVPSVMLGWLLATPLFNWLKQLGVFTDAIALSMGFPLASLLGLLALLVASTVLAAWLSVRPREARNAIESAQAPLASDTQHRMGKRRIVWAAVSVAALLAFLFVIPQGEATNPIISLLLPVLIVLPLATLAPVIIPPIARAFAYLIAPLAGGPAVLVGQRASRDGRRFSSSVLPLLVLMGVMAGFAIGSSPDNANLRQQIEAEFRAPFILQTENRESVNEFAEPVREEFGSAAAIRYTSSTLLIDIARPSGPLTLFNFADFDHLADVVMFEVLAGSVDGLSPNQLISARAGDAIGDTVTVSNGEGSTATLSVAALVEEDQFFTDLVLDWSVLEQLQPTTWETGVLLSEEAASSLQVPLPSGSTIFSKAEYVEQQIDRRESGAAAGNLALFGTTYAIALIALVQGLAAATLKRRNEFGALRQLGASRTQIIVQLLVEAVVLTLSSAFLLVLACAVMVSKFFAERTEPLAQLNAQVPWGQISAAYLVVSMVFMVTVVISGGAAMRTKAAH